jgi:hypothetical protein
MSATKAPVEVAARVLHDRIYTGFARPEWEHRSPEHQQIFLEDASAAFGSVDVDGLARVLRGTPPEAWVTVDESTRARWHAEAERVIAWLTGGGA